MNNIDFEKLKNEGIEWNKSICRSKLNSFEAGAQSRQQEVVQLQTEINELKSKLETAEKNLNNAFKTIKFEQQYQEELQNRIDDALKALEKLDGYDYNGNLDAVFLILKGEEND